MQISFALDTLNRTDVELAHNTIGYVLGFLPKGEPLGAAIPTPATDPAHYPNDLSVVMLEPAPVQPEAPQPVKAAEPKAAKPKLVKKAAAAIDPASNPVVTEGRVYTLDEVTAKLREYSQDDRYGFTEVHAILNRHGTHRVTKLDPERYAAFVAEIDAALLPAQLS